MPKENDEKGATNVAPGPAPEPTHLDKVVAQNFAPDEVQEATENLTMFQSYFTALQRLNVREGAPAAAAFLAMAHRGN